PVLAPVVSVALYLWLEVSTQWLTQQFWDLCAKAFDVAQSKKFFGVITFGSTFGSLLASFVVLPVLQSRQLPTECNLLVSSGMLFFVAGILLFSAENFTANGQTAVKKTGYKAENLSGDTASSVAIITDIQARTYLKHICFFDMLATVMRVLVDNTTLTVVSLQAEEEVKASLSMINGLQSFLMIPMQLLSGSFFTHFGVMYGISMLPVTIFLFGASTYVSNSAYSLIFTRALYNAVSQAIFNPARQLLWLPFNENERSRFQNFVCGPFRSLSRIFGAILSMFLTATWFADALAARKSYASEFYASLRQGYLDLTSPLVDFTPDQETLVNGEQNQANFVLSSLSHDHIGLFSQVLESRVVGLKIVGKELPELLDQLQNKREGLAGALKVLDVSDFPLEDKLNFLLHLVEKLLVASKVQNDDDAEASKPNKNSEVLHNLFGKDAVMEELVVDALLSLVAATDEKTMNSFSQLMDPIHHALSIKIREAHEMRHSA
ncbi:hypothetical protein BBO99_00002382, partial [Phytophthora kernoviae]